MTTRHLCSAVGFAFIAFVFACGSGESGGDTGDCETQGCDSPPPGPAPQTCATAADCEQPQEDCYYRCVCNDAGVATHVSYQAPSCVAGKCVWQTTSDNIFPSCPVTMPEAGSPCSTCFSTRVGPGCAWTCGTGTEAWTIRGRCSAGAWEIDSTCP